MTSANPTGPRAYTGILQAASKIVRWVGAHARFLAALSGSRARALSQRMPRPACHGLCTRHHIPLETSLVHLPPPQTRLQGGGLLGAVEGQQRAHHPHLPLLSVAAGGQRHVQEGVSALSGRGAGVGGGQGLAGWAEGMGTLGWRGRAMIGACASEHLACKWEMGCSPEWAAPYPIHACRPRPSAFHFTPSARRPAQG